MSKNTDTSIKLLVLYDILSKMTDEDHALSTNEIIAELSKRGIAVSRKVLPSDIALLNKYGYEILSYTKKARYYYVTHHAFDNAEITMLADVIKASKLTESKKANFIDKLYATIGVHSTPKSLDNIIAYNASKYGNPCLIYNIDAIDRAIKEDKKVSFLYYSLDENKKKVYHLGGKRYVFNPLCMIWSKDNYYLLCYDDRHDGTSRYRIDKMEDVQVEELPRLEKEEFKDFNPDTYRKQVVSMFGGELQKVTIQFAREMLSDLYDRYGTDIRIQKVSEDTFKTTIEVQVSKTFFLWVIGTMGKVKILSPGKAKQEFDTFVEELKNIYNC